MTDNSGTDKSTSEHMQRDEPVFEELSNAELDDVQGAGTKSVSGGVLKGEFLSTKDAKRVSILTTNFKAT